MSPDLTMDHRSPSAEDLLARDAWIRRLAAAVVGGDLPADDVGQETWLRVLRARLRLRVRGEWIEHPLRRRR